MADRPVTVDEAIQQGRSLAAQIRDAAAELNGLLDRLEEEHRDGDDSSNT